MRFVRASWFLIAVVLTAACGDDDSNDNGIIDAGGDLPGEITAQLAGENEVPPVATTASGQVSATLTGSTLVIDGEFTGLESDLMEVSGSSAHVHEADIDEAGPIVFNLDVTSADMRSGTLAGTAELTGAQVQLFEQGLLYVNIHTVQNPPGELRAQLARDAPDRVAIDAAFDAALRGDSEVPTVDTDATGSATAVLRGDQLTVSGSFADLSTPLLDVGDAGSAHIHEAPPGDNGPVVFPLAVAAAENMQSGRFSLSQTLTAEQRTALEDGNYYVNIHTKENPGGEIRGQLTARETN